MANEEKSAKELFFSIIVPAHNEEKYIVATMQRLAALTYPKDSYEVIVVENGSVDTTFATAKTFAEENAAAKGNVHVFSIPESGVSKARNFGSAHAKKDGDWVFFLDADTFPDPEFLREVADFLKKNPQANYAVGTAELQPYPKSLIMNVIYWFTNFFFKMKGGAFGGALFVRRSLLETFSFDEDLQMGEDDNFAQKLRASGAFFFFSTKHVHTSTRRYQNGGWLKIPVWIGLWIFAMIVPHHGKSTPAYQRRLKYKVVR
jgi:glycosyltransferase involved in cell wall biosynthesis